MNKPKLSAEMEKRLKKKLAEELHIDWAFKNVHGKPDTIIITGTPKGSYETDYNLFVENMTHFLATALEEQMMQAEVKTGLNAFGVTMEEIAKARADEREKVLSEVEEWLVDESEVVGFDCDDPDCECHQEEPIDFDGAIIRNRLRAELRAKLNQLKGTDAE